MATEVHGDGASGLGGVGSRSVAAVQQARIRLGLFLPGETVSAWQAKVIRGVLASDDVDCVLVLGRGLQHSSSVNRPRGGLFSAYEWLDRQLTKRLGGTTDAFETLNVADALGHIPRAVLSEGLDGAGLLEHARLDVLLDLVGDVPPEQARYAKYGIWSFQHGDSLAFGHEPGTFWEMLHGRPLAITQLQMLLSNGETRTLYRSFSRLHEFSLHMNQNIAYWKAAEFALRCARTLRAGGWKALESLPTFGEGAVRAARPPSGAIPENREVVQLWGKLAGRTLRRVALDLRTRKSWRLGWRPAAQPGAVNQLPFNFLLPPPGRFYADPFLIRNEGRTYLFFEDYVRADGRALISWVSLDEANARASEPSVALATEDHLSYPYIFKWDGQIYMIPERIAKRRIELWRAQTFPHTWVLDRVLIDSLDAVDATWFQAKDLFWILTNVAPTGAGSAADELFLFYSRSPFGPFTSHPQNPVVSNVRGARPGGRVFLRDGVLIRPGQDSSVRYGGRLILHQIDQLSETLYAEHEVGTIEADWFEGCLGTHTYDCDGHFEVLDGFERVPRGRHSRGAELP